MDVLKVCGLEKEYEKFSLKKIDFKVPQGAIVGMVGPNGSGKTTTIKCLLNSIAYDGEITYWGRDLKENELEIKNKLGIVLDNSFFYEKNTAEDIAKVLKHAYDKWDDSVYYSYLDRFNIDRKMKIEKLSKGMKMKLYLATALSHEAELLILDEPSSGLDPLVREEFLDILLEYINDGKKSVLMSSHITSDLEKIADYLIMIYQGEILLEGEKDHILDSFGMAKLSEDDLKKIDKKDIKGLRDTGYGYEALIVNKNKYGDFLIDKVTIDDILVNLTRGIK